MGKHDTVMVEGKVGHETAKAISVEVEDVGVVWFPLSTVHEIHRQDGYIVVDEWVARARGVV